ncbi:hypothetical protein Tdes44962_MAKER02564 [Teratosphaeria destructans]|uniref:SnoaL-like domain-containing protein n=1 Tax=Teratosphaeria destructans TaxID=418781 RepID=A0A9W7ST67_9PEZI|nr:hypothetical protein Tdes44962_MAKER02564 [Teratosphaeria destructans]
MKNEYEVQVSVGALPVHSLPDGCLHHCSSSLEEGADKVFFCCHRETRISQNCRSTTATGEALMSQYIAEVPSDGSVKPEILTYYERFYHISDTPDAHLQYAEQFTKNAKLIMVSDEANGRDAILQIRKSMWEKVTRRSHKPIRIYTFGPGSADTMLYGTVDYELKDGRKASVPWSARSHFTEEDGELKQDFYQVYLDTAAMANAR